jgi:hypothetical protein
MSFGMTGSLRKAQTAFDHHIHHRNRHFRNLLNTTAYHAHQIVDSPAIYCTQSCQAFDADISAGLGDPASAQRSEKLDSEVGRRVVVEMTQSYVNKAQ